MMGWQNLLLCNIPRDGGGNDAGNGPDGGPGDNQGSAVGDPSNDTQDTVGPNDPSPPDATPPDSQDPDAPSPNAKEAAFQGGLQGLGFGTSLSNALGDTSLGSFGLSGVTSNTSAPGTSTSFGGAVTDPGSVPGYEGPGNTVADTSFGSSLAPDLGNLGGDLTSGANSVFADPSVTNVAYDRVGALTNVTVNTPETVVTPPETVVTPPETVVTPPETDSDPANLGGDPGVSPSLGAEPSIGDPSGGDPGGGGNGGGSDSPANTVVPITTADVLTPVTVTPTTTTISPVKYDVSNFLGNLGKPTYTPTPSVYSSYPISVTPQYGAPVAQQGIGQFYKPYFPLVPYQRKYP